MNSVFFELVNSTSVTVILTSFTCFLHGLLLWYSSQKDTITRLDRSKEILQTAQLQVNVYTKDLKNRFPQIIFCNTIIRHPNERVQTGLPAKVFTPNTFPSISSKFQKTYKWDRECKDYVTK